MRWIVLSIALCLVGMPAVAQAGPNDVWCAPHGDPDATCDLSRLTRAEQAAVLRTRMLEQSRRGDDRAALRTAIQLRDLGLAVAKDVRFHAILLRNLGRNTEALALLEGHFTGPQGGLRPGDVRLARIIRAGLRLREGDSEGALADLDYLIAEAPFQVAILNAMRARVLARMGRAKAARAELQNASGFDRVTPNAFRAMVETYLILGDLDAARDLAPTIPNGPVHASNRHQAVGLVACHGGDAARALEALSLAADRSVYFLRLQAFQLRQAGHLEGPLDAVSREDHQTALTHWAAESCPLPF